MCLCFSAVRLRSLGCIWSGSVLCDIWFFPPFSLSHYFYLNPSLHIFWPVSVRAISGKQEISRGEARPVQGSPGFLTYFLLVSSHVPPVFHLYSFSYSCFQSLYVPLLYAWAKTSLKKCGHKLEKSQALWSHVTFWVETDFTGNLTSPSLTHTETLYTHALCD